MKTLLLTLALILTTLTTNAQSFTYEVYGLDSIYVCYQIESNYFLGFKDTSLTCILTAPNCGTSVKVLDSKRLLQIFAYNRKSHLFSICVWMEEEDFSACEFYVDGIFKRYY